MPEIKLSNKQQLFCEEYMVDLNATQAAIRAGYSKKTSHSIGAENLTKPEINSYVTELKAKRNARVELKQDEVLKELKLFAYSDITETMELTFTEIKELPVEIRRMICSFKKTETTFDGGEKVTYEIKFVDKMRAFEMLNKHIGFYDEDNKQKSTTIVVKGPEK